MTRIRIDGEHFQKGYGSFLSQDFKSHTMKAVRAIDDGIALALAGVMVEKWGQHRAEIQRFQSRFSREGSSSYAFDVPYVVGITGAVSSGKSDLSRKLEGILRLLLPQKKTLVLGMDHFLYPTKILKEKNVFGKKGFPQTYDHRNLLDVIQQFRQKQYPITIPSYSHQVYDTLPDGETFNAGDLIIIDGLHVLHVGDGQPLKDACHLTVYVDASMTLLKEWYQKRFSSLVASAVDGSHYASYRGMPEETLLEKSETIWESINVPNIQTNIIPFKERADLVFLKAAEHTLKEVGVRL